MYVHKYSRSVFVSIQTTFFKFLQAETVSFKDSIFEDCSDLKEAQGEKSLAMAPNTFGLSLKGTFLNISVSFEEQFPSQPRRTSWIIRAHF